MAVADFVDVQGRYAAERPKYERLCAVIGGQLEKRLRERGLETLVQWRAKEIDSFTKKALRKGYADPLAEIGDKAGVRVIVHYHADLATVEEVVREVTEIHDRHSKLDALAYDTLGYLGVHYDLTLLPEFASANDADLAGLHAELQVHSKAQSAWAVVSHDLLYKTATDLPPNVQRGITRLVALVELFDDEVSRLRSLIEDDPDRKELLILDALDTQLVRFTSKRPDHALSALSVPALVRLYEADAEEVMRERVEPFVAVNEGKLTEIYTRYEADTRANPLLFQPEALLLFDLMGSDPDGLVAAWPSDVLPFSLLENLAVIWGAELPVAEQ